MVMPCYQYDLTVRGGEISPRTVDGGTAGDRGALRLVFAFEDADAAAYTYRVEAVNGAGGYDCTERYPLTDGKLTLDVPSAWAVAGNTVVRLVQLTVEDGEERERRYFPPVTVSFAYRDGGDGDAVAAPLWQELITRTEAAVEQALQSAVDAATQAELAATYAAAADAHASSVDVRADMAVSAAEQAMGIVTAVQLMAENTQEDVLSLGNTISHVSGIADVANEKADDALSQIQGVSDTAQLAEQKAETAKQLAEEANEGVSRANGIAEDAQETAGRVEAQMGDVEAALDGILAIQTALIGGDGV